jgi:hypothetical protein
MASARRVSRFRFPAEPGLSGKGNEVSSLYELVPVGSPADASLAAQLVEGAAKGGRPDATGLAELCETEWPLGL